MAPKIGMTNLWADGGILPVSGVTEWVISSNEGTTEEGLLIVFLCTSVCLFFSTGEKIVLIKYSGYRNIGKIIIITISKCYPPTNNGYIFLTNSFSLGFISVVLAQSS